jgi:hypothetical protein
MENMHGLSELGKASHEGRALAEQLNYVALYSNANLNASLVSRGVVNCGPVGLIPGAACWAL